MKYQSKFLITASVLFFYCSCHSVNKKNISSDSTKPITAIVSDIFIQKADSTILFTVTALHEFSDTATKDTFSLTFDGYTIHHGGMTFKIVDKNNKTIYYEGFGANVLFSDENDDMPITKQRKDTIMARMKRFFNEENFIKPAIKIIPKEDRLSKDSPEEYKEIWEEISLNNAAIGFTYSSCYRGFPASSIVYSRKRQQVVLYLYK